MTFEQGSGTIEFAGAQTLGGNTLTAATTSGNIQLDNGATITSTAAGNAIVLAASGGNFINNSGSGSPLVDGNGHWVVYSTVSTSDTNGAGVMNPATTVNGTIYPTTTGASGNTWFYSSGRYNGGTGYPPRLSTISSLLPSSVELQISYTGNTLEMPGMYSGQFDAVPFALGIAKLDLSLPSQILTPEPENDDRDDQWFDPHALLLIRIRDLFEAVIG